MHYNKWIRIPLGSPRVSRGKSPSKSDKYSSKDNVAGRVESAAECCFGGKIVTFCYRPLVCNWIFVGKAHDHEGTLRTPRRIAPTVLRAKVGNPTGGSWIEKDCLAAALMDR
jgi:hypothetical protein